MFNSGNCGIPVTMNVEPANSGGCYNGGMNGLGNMVLKISELGH